MSSELGPPLPMSDRILVSEKDGAQLCGVSLPTFRSWRDLGLIRPVALPGGIRRNLYRRTDLEELAERFAADATDAS